MRGRTKVALAAAVLLAGGAGLAAEGPAEVVPVAATVAVTGDTGDGQATTTYDGAMLRRRVAIAIHPVPGADRDRLRAELRAASPAGPLTEATFAVFSEELLSYLVPEITVVLPEGVPVAAAEAFMRDRRPAGVGFYLVRPVLVHDLTFAVLPAAGLRPAGVRDRLDREGVLADSLNRHVTTVQPAGVTVRYFGAVLSDATIGAVRDAMARAAEVPAGRVVVAASETGPGVDLAHGVPDLTGEPPGHH